MEKNNTALTVEEVNVYSQDCGDLRLHCVVDCPNGTSWLSPAQ